MEHGESEKVDREDEDNEDVEDQEPLRGCAW
jgi:hypothetical protein